MATEVDRIVTVLEAITSDLDQKMQRSARISEVAMGQVAGSAKRAEQAVSSSAVVISRSFEQVGQRSRLLGYQIADVGTQLAAGTSPFLIIAQQAPQVANALEGTTGAAGRMAAFFSGPWGAALLAAGSVVGVLISRHKEASESVEDLVRKLEESAEKSNRARRAQEIFGNTLSGVTEALRKNREALEGLNDEGKTAARRALEEAIAASMRLKTIRATTAALLDQAEAEAAIARMTAGANDAGLAWLTRAEQGAQRVRDSLAATDAAIIEADRQIQDALSRRVVERSGMSAEDKLNEQYDKEVEAARRAALANDTVTSSLRRQTDAIEARRQAALKELRDRDKPERRRTRQQAFGDFTSALQERGVSITSGYRTQAQQNALRRRLGSDAAKVSAHSAHRAVDVPLSVRDDAILEAAAAAGLTGVRIQRKPGARGGPHAHVSWTGHGARGDASGAAASAERLAREEEAARQRRIRDEQAFQDELAQLNGEVLQLRRQSVRSAEEQAQIEVEAIMAARDRQNATYEAAVVQGRLTEAQADVLIETNNQAARIRAMNVRLREQQRLDEQRYAIAVSDLNDAQAVERARSQFARTLAERRDSEMRLLEYQHEEERLALERLKNQEGLNDAERDRLRRAEARMNERHSLEARAVEQRHLSPLEEFLDRAPQSAEEMNEALERVAAEGLASLNDGLAEAITSFIKLGGTAGRIVNQILTDIVRLALYKNLTAPLGGLLGRVLGSIAGTAARSPGGGIGGGSGAEAGLRAASGMNAVAGQLIRINEGAGRGRAEGWIPAGSGKIIPLGQMEHLRRGGGPGAAGLVRVQLGLSGDIDARIASVSGPVAAEIVREAAPQIAAQAKAGTLRHVTRPTL